jgi:hemerythrin HHE cation binding domain-containing protein
MRLAPNLPVPQIFGRAALGRRAREAREDNMQAIQLLKQDHVKAKAAFQEIETTPASGRSSLWGKLRPELELHEQMEEKCLYGPVAREVQGDPVLASWETTHLHEVQEAEGLIKEIDRLDPAKDAWLAAVKKLRGALEQHIRKEEQDIWPKIERAWNPARLEEAGRQMEAMKQRETAHAR